MRVSVLGVLIAAVLSNPGSCLLAVMLLLPHMGGADTEAVARAGPVQALATTMAGKRLLVGSIANPIVAELAKKAGVPLDGRQHACTGIAVTRASRLVLAAASF